jgi:hypothetical protein
MFFLITNTGRELLVAEGIIRPVVHRHGILDIYVLLLD